MTPNTKRTIIEVALIVGLPIIGYFSFRKKDPAAGLIGGLILGLILAGTFDKLSKGVW
jgi:hypothetical protein